ncbi:hypothetical protein L4C54_11620 [Vibrio lamellibrachiae]|uniref:hypothetical protein n=1 Tax=Vibrio lamellibrachiae TaxID=2910253 RepID=UPI003D09C2AC
MMKKLLCIALSSLLLIGCGKNDGRTYIGDNNYYIMVDSEGGEFEGWDFTAKVEPFPKYFVYRANEWPVEDVTDESSYDLPRIQFTWANMTQYPGKDPDPLYNDYEGQVKLWSMKTDGTDLRLVTDFEGLMNRKRDIGAKFVRSPNNRYLAFSYSGGYRAVLDLKTREVIDIERNSGAQGYLWAEDSSYLYYRGGWDVYKWDVETREITQMDFPLSDTGLILNDRRYLVSEFGVAVYDLESGEEIQSVLWGEHLKIDRARAEHKAISPEGDFAWGTNIYGKLFYVDIENNEVKPAPYSMPYLIGQNSRFGNENRHATVMSVRDYENKLAWDWRPLGHNRTLDPITLYNADANDGLWFKEVE